MNPGAAFVVGFIWGSAFMGFLALLLVAISNGAT